MLNVSEENYNMLMNIKTPINIILGIILFILLIYIIIIKFLDNDSKVKEYIKQGFFINIGFMLSNLVISIIGIVIAFIVLILIK